MTCSPEAEAEALAGRRNEILRRIASAAQEAGRSPDEIDLVAISKRQPEARIDAALASGHRIFGENRVEEAQTRWAERRAAYPDLELRLVGPLQSRKTAEAVALFDVIETLDREKLARKLREEMDRQGRTPRLYVQVNTGEEPQKSGLAPDETAAFVERMRAEYGFEIEGLMCIPPAEEPPGLHFALLAKLARACSVGKLSMGMSADYPVAVKLGASSVRVGSALFGAREG